MRRGAGLITTTRAVAISLHNGHHFILYTRVYCGKNLALSSVINCLRAGSLSEVCLLLVFIAISAVFAPLIAPTNPYDLSTVSILDSRLSPGEKMFSGNVALLGTDGAGRDVLSAIILAFGLV